MLSVVSATGSFAPQAATPVCGTAGPTRLRRKCAKHQKRLHFATNLGKAYLMDIFSFIARSLVLAIWVSFRLLPIAIFVYAIIGVLIFATDNAIVIGMIIVLLGTFGTTFIYLTGIRAGLMSLRATTPPTANGLFGATVKLFFVHLLLQLLMMIVLYAVVIAFFHFVLMPAWFPEVQETVAGVPGLPGGVGMMLTVGMLSSPFADLAGVGSLVGPSFLFLTVLSICGGICLGVFGVPMAGLAANAVQHSPRNDLVFGMGSHFLHQFTLYFIAVALPSMALYAGYPAYIAMMLDAPSLPFIIGSLIGVVAISFYIYCIPFAGMALAYRGTREAQAAERQFEAAPVVDVVEQEASVRSLRQQRQSGSGGASVYVPERQRASRPTEDDNSYE